MADLLTEYQSWNGMGRMPAMELRHTILPLPCFRIWDSTALVTLSMPKRLTSSCRWDAAGSVASAAPEMP